MVPSFRRPMEWTPPPATCMNTPSGASHSPYLVRPQQAMVPSSRRPMECHRTTCDLREHTVWCIALAVVVVAPTQITSPACPITGEPSTSPNTAAIRFRMTTSGKVSWYLPAGPHPRFLRPWTHETCTQNSPLCGHVALIADFLDVRVTFTPSVMGGPIVGPDGCTSAPRLGVKAHTTRPAMSTARGHSTSNHPNSRAWSRCGHRSVELFFVADGQ